MATLQFNGSSHYVRGAGHGAMNGAVTIACLLKATGTNATTFVTPRFNDLPAFYGSSSILCSAGYNTTGTNSTAVTPINRTDWYLLAVTKVAGTVRPWFHSKNLTTGEAWVHGEGTNAINNPSSASGGEMRIGYSVYSYWFAGDFALAAWWDGTALSNAQIESLGANKRTSDLYGLSPAPSSLTELNTATPVDLMGLETWTMFGPTLTGTDPPGWTFGAAELLEPPPETHPPTGGDYANTTGGEVQTVVRGGTPEEPLRGGTPQESTRAGTYDETATGGEVL